MKKLHAERLLQVVRVLDELPKGKRFDIHGWMRCGIVGCAVGWAASDPWFTRRGLKLEQPRPNIYEPIYGALRSCLAVQHFFGLTSPQESDLFYGFSYSDPTKRNVIRRIKAFVKANT